MDNYNNFLSPPLPLTCLQHAQRAVPALDDSVRKQRYKHGENGKGNDEDEQPEAPPFALDESSMATTTLKPTRYDHPRGTPPPSPVSERSKIKKHNNMNENDDNDTSLVSPSSVMDVVMPYSTRTTTYHNNNTSGTTKKCSTDTVLTASTMGNSKTSSLLLPLTSGFSTSSLPSSSSPSSPSSAISLPQGSTIHAAAATRYYSAAAEGGASFLITTPTSSPVESLKMDHREEEDDDANIATVPFSPPFSFATATATNSNKNSFPMGSSSTTADSTTDTSSNNSSFMNHTAAQSSPSRTFSQLMKLAAQEGDDDYNDDDEEEDYDSNKNEHETMHSSQSQWRSGPSLVESCKAAPPFWNSQATILQSHYIAQSCYLDSQLYNGNERLVDNASSFPVPQHMQGRQHQSTQLVQPQQQQQQQQQQQRGGWWWWPNGKGNGTCTTTEAAIPTRPSAVTTTTATTTTTTVAVPATSEVSSDGVSVTQMSADSFQVVISIPQCEDTTQVMDILGNPDMLQFWCHAVAGIRDKQHVSTIATTTTTTGATTTTKSPQSSSSASSSSPPPPLLLTQRQEQERQYDGEWMEITTPAPLGAPHGGSGGGGMGHVYSECISSVTNSIWNALGFPLMGTIKIFLERQQSRACMELMGPFAGDGGMTRSVVHKIGVLKESHHSNGIVLVDQVQIVFASSDALCDNATSYNNNNNNTGGYYLSPNSGCGNNEGDTCASCCSSCRSCGCCSRVWKCVQDSLSVCARRSNSPLIGYMDQTKYDLRRLRQLVQNGGENGAYVYMRAAAAAVGSTAYSGNDNDMRAPLLGGGA